MLTKYYFTEIFSAVLIVNLMWHWVEDIMDPLRCGKPSLRDVFSASIEFAVAYGLLSLINLAWTLVK
jgi:hypothetical protein